ncbi:hypothetical protein WJX79_002432 [Trebouxia sp. C0005]
METFHRRAVKLPKGTRREHLTLRPQATFGSHGRAVVLKNGKEIGHFLLSVRICGSLACIREPAVGNWNTLDGLWGCPSGSKTWADWKKMPIFYFLYDWLLGLLEDALSPVERPHSVTITAAWQHLLCVVILGSGIFLVAAFRLTWLLLVYCYKGRHSQEAHLPGKHPMHHHMARHGGMIHADSHSDPVTPAGQSGGLFKKTGESGDLTRSPATPNHSLQYPADGSRPPSAAFKELGEKTSHEGKASGGVTFAEAKHKGIAAGHDVHFQKQPHNVGPNTPHKSGKHTAPDHVTATPADTLKGHPSPLPHPHTESTTPEMTDTPEDASPSVSPETPDNAPPSQLPETLEDAPPPDVADTPEDTARKARLAEMRKALEEAGVETVSRADAHTVSLQADNKRLRLLLASASAQLAAAQQGSGYFRRLFLSAAGLAKLVPTRGFKNGQYDMPYNAKLIDEGGSAHIYLETLHGEQRATKYSKKGAKAAGGSAHELRMHLRCAGPNTVKILSVGMDKVPRGPVLSANVVCFSMEVASQSLKAYIGQASGGFKGSNRDGLVFELAHTKSIMRQVVQAMQGVHDHATLHGDVKPDNFLVFMHKDSAQLESVKITDFGLARDLIEGCHHITPTTDGTRGTQGWIAPELYAQNLSPEQRKGCNVTAKADVYAAGWVFFEVLCGLSPLLFH